MTINLDEEVNWGKSANNDRSRSWGWRLLGKDLVEDGDCDWRQKRPMMGITVGKVGKVEQLTGSYF